MIKTIIYLILIYRVYSLNWWQPYTTSVYTNNILYVYDTFRDDAKSARITKYDLKDGLIKNLKKEYFNLDSGSLYNSPQFFAINDNFKNKFPSGESAWMFTCDNGPYKSNLGVDYPGAQLKYVDNGKKDVVPNVKIRDLYSVNMTQSGYSVNGVTKSGSFAIFIFGGITKHPNYKDLVVTNTLHKYYLKDNEWKDLSSSSIKERPSAFHKAVSIDDKYLFLLGGVSPTSNKANAPMIENTQAMGFNSFENIRRYNITKGKWDTIKTSNSGGLSVDLKLGRYGFSATYNNGKIYVYGGMVSEDGSINGKETISPYLGILDTNTLIWEWFHPTDSNGKTVNRGLSFHDSLIINNQLILTHGGVSDEKHKYKIHAIDLETKQFSNFIGPPKSDSLDEEDVNPDIQGSQDSQESQKTQESSGFPGYAIAIIVVALVFIIAIIAYLIVKKRRQRKISSRDSLQTLQEVWATPKNAILHTKMPDDTDFNLMTGNTFTNLSSSSAEMRSTLDSSPMVRSNSRINQFYMNLPYFQHEVDTQDQRISTMLATNVQLLSSPDNHNTNPNQQ